MIFTFAVGFLIEPEAAFPEIPGAFVRGLAKFFGQNGGNIGVYKIMQKRFGE
jgi:hypothetical protein